MESNGILFALNKCFIKLRNDGANLGSVKLVILLSKNEIPHALSGFGYGSCPNTTIRTSSGFFINSSALKRKFGSGKYEVLFKKLSWSSRDLVN